jgi:hypothetical protein
MTIDDLKSALEKLSTERIERLVSTLEKDPNLKVTVGAWRPQCPMLLAGFDPLKSSPTAPEQRFAAVWDRFAAAEARPWWALPFSFGRGRVARRTDVQTLLRVANGVLASRTAGGEREQAHLDVPMYPLLIAPSFPYVQH